MKKVSLLSLLFLTACVTINIYFPAAATEKVADEIIQDIQQGVQKSPQSEQQSLLPEPLPTWKISLYQAVDQTLSLFISSAYAGDANLSVNTPEIRGIRARMQARFASLRGLYYKGFIGIQVDGLLTQRGNIPLKERNKVKKLVSAENADRIQLYKAIAVANGHPEWENQIKSTFAQSWINHAQSGWWYQNSGGRWVQK